MVEPVLAMVLAQAAPSGPSFIEGLLPFAVLAAIFYFLIYRPQAQKQKAHEALVQALQKDDRVVLSSGLYGRIVEVGSNTIVLEASGKVRLTFEKASVARKQDESAGKASK
jgi:preprotein translocase subunit YajC